MPTEELEHELRRAFAKAAAGYQDPELACQRLRQRKYRPGSGHRRLAAGMTAVAAAGSVVLGLGVSVALGSAPSRGTGTIRTEAFTLAENANGTAALRLTQNQMFHPGALQQPLAQAGIPALVKVGTLCTSNPAPPKPPGVLSVQLPNGTPVGEVGHKRWPPVPADAVTVIKPRGDARRDGTVLRLCRPRTDRQPHLYRLLYLQLRRAREPSPVTRFPCYHFRSDVGLRRALGQVVGAVLAVPSHVRGFYRDRVAAESAVEFAHRAPVGVRAEDLLGEPRCARPAQTSLRALRCLEHGQIKTGCRTDHLAEHGREVLIQQQPRRCGERGAVCQNNRIRLYDATAPTRLTKRGTSPLVSEVGWTRPAPVRSQDTKGARMGNRNSRKERCYLRVCVELRGFEPLTPSMRTLATMVDGGRCRWSVYEARRGGTLTVAPVAARVAALNPHLAL
jgi:hypothetical protein